MTSAEPSIPLRTAALGDLSTEVIVPTYDRVGLRPSVVHIGVGGFHRAHLATYIDELCEAGHRDWAIVGCGVLAGDVAMETALRQQDMLYTLVTRGAAATSVQVIGSIIDYVHVVPEMALAIEQIASAETQIVSLTITEGGYPIDDLTGEYLPDSPNAGPTSAFGIVAAALELRRQRGSGPITVMSCDNIMTNGSVARAATLGEAAKHGDQLIDWIAEHVSFPNSMVDRITPATTPSDGAWLQKHHGIHDEWPVVTEPFRQWVVEDHFAGDRLPLEELDIIVTDNVEPYEFMKLRLLNAGHSCLAYLAALHGIETVDAAMAEPWIEQYVRHFLDHESKPVLPEVAGIDVDDYIETLIERFSNPAIGDQISRLCLDGSAKFPKFLLPTVRAQLAQGGPVESAALALAGWCQYLCGVNDHGDPIDVSPDPQLEDAREFAAASIEEPANFLGLESVFGADLQASEPFVRAFSDALRAIRSNGVRSTVESTLHGFLATDSA